MLNPCQEEEVFFDTEDHLTGKQEVIGSLRHDIWLAEPQSITERRETFLSRMGFLDHFESYKVESRSITESAEAESSYSESLCGSIYDTLLYERRESNSEANSSVDYSYQDWLHDMNIIDMDVETDENPIRNSEIKQNRRKQKDVMHFWRQFTQRLKKRRAPNCMKEAKHSATMTRIRVEQNQKRCTELTGLYSGQELKAHNGLIWTIKFSPDRKYLASGGEDGVVCVWRVRSKDSSCDPNGCIFGNRDGEKQSARTKIKYSHASIVIPDKIFHIEEEPVHKFKGHNSDVLDLAWSSSNYLISSSMDKTVRLWKVGSDQCLRVFQHFNYVTCVQFNPVDENYFISGSIDGKVRIWGIKTGRVEEWANVRDIVTAVCYQPNGKGFLVGSVSGICRFYDLPGEELVLNAEINIYGRKKSSGSRIISIQFLANDSQRVMITSDDAKIRILDGYEVVRKYKGLAKSGNQISASFSCNGKHIISVGEDSRVYLFNHDDLHIESSKQVKSIRSCEHFSSGGTTVALAWPMARDHHGPLLLLSRRTEEGFFSLANWFSMDSSRRGSLTWPEEKLPSIQGDDSSHQKQQQGLAWGLVFVTAHCDGSIRTFHNYGLPVRTS